MTWKRGQPIKAAFSVFVHPETLLHLLNNQLSPEALISVSHFYELRAFGDMIQIKVQLVALPISEHSALDSRACDIGNANQRLSRLAVLQTKKAALRLPLSL